MIPKRRKVLFSSLAAITSGSVAEDHAAIDPRPAVDAIVIIGASIENSMFGKSLVTPNSHGTNALQSLGHAIPVYGYATPGALTDQAVEHYTAARSAHPNALIIGHWGGNNVTQARPYATMEQSNRDALFSQLEALRGAAAGDDRFYPTNLTFRDYDDATFADEALGAKPFNDNIIEPWISANFPHAIASYGRPIFDFYRIVLQNHELWLSNDNIHLSATTPGGIGRFRTWIVERLADVLGGVEPEMVPDRLAPEPEGPPGGHEVAILQFYSSANGVEQVAENGMDISAGYLSGRSAALIDINGAATGISVALSFAGNPVQGPADPGSNYNTTGIASGAGYNKTLLSTPITSRNFFVTPSVTAVLTFTGLGPGEDYIFGFVGARGQVSDGRRAQIAIGSQTVNWICHQNPPQIHSITAQADGGGQVIAVLSVYTGGFAHLSGLSVEKSE